MYKSIGDISIKLRLIIFTSKILCLRPNTAVFSDTEEDRAKNDL